MSNYKEYVPIYERYGKKAFLKVKPDAMADLGKIIFELVTLENGKAVKGKNIKLYLTLDYALALAKMISNQSIFSVIARGGVVETSYGGGKTDGGFECRWAKFEKSTSTDKNGNPLFCITGVSAEAFKTSTGGYSPKQGAKFLNVHVPIDEVGLYEMASAIERAVLRFTVRGLTDFEVNVDNGTDSATPVPSEPSCSEAYEEDEEVIETTSSTPVTTSKPTEPMGTVIEKEIILKKLAKDEFGVFIPTFTEDGKADKPIRIGKMPEEGSNLARLIEYLNNNESCKTRLKLDEVAKAYFFIDVL